MNKKSLDRKVAQKFIIENRDNGKTNQEIYNELSQQYYDKKGVALLITGTVKAELKTKFKIYNSILIGILFLSILLKFMVVGSLVLQTGQLWTLVLMLVVPLLSGYFMYEIARYNAPVYRLCGILTIMGFFQTISKAENGPDIMINIIFTVAIAGLSFYLDGKMFPDFSPNNLKKDNKGEYILN